MSQRSALTGRITGTVQGVFFRAETRDKARALGVDGWVRNTGDGAVEVMLAGSPEALAQMREWLRQGPPRARVQEVALEPCADPGVTDFQIRG